MSLSVPDMKGKVVRVNDPVTALNLNEWQKYSALKGGQQVTHKVFTSSSYSDSQVSFTAPPPSIRTIIDRKVRVEMQFRIKAFNAQSQPVAFALGTYDGPRAYPITSVCNTVQLTLNNQSFSTNLNDYALALLRFNNNDMQYGTEYSMTPSRQDYYQRYGDWTTYGDAANVLALSGQGNLSSDLMTNRGGWKVDSINAVDGQGNATDITMTFVENIYLSPLLFGKCEHMGFSHLQTFDINFTFGNLSRVWSSGNTNISSITANLASAPRMYFIYKTPSDLDAIPDKLSYPLFNIERFPTNAGNLTAGSPPYKVSLSNVTLNSIPRRIYLFARRRNADLTAFTTDTFARITAVNINWNNNSGLLSSCPEAQLYALSSKNGLNMSWSQWSQFTGSVLALDFGTDIQLNPLEAPGMLGQFQIQIDLTIQNISSQTVNYDCYLVVASEGIFTLTKSGQALSSIAPLSRQDVFNAHTHPRYDYEFLEKYTSGYSGGSFMDTLRSMVKPSLKCIAEQALKHLGRGEGEGEGEGEGMKKKKKMVVKRKGGELLGGKMISRAELKKMMK